MYRNKTTLRRFLIYAVLVIIIALLFAVWAWPRHAHNNNSPSASSTEAPASTSIQPHQPPKKASTANASGSSQGGAIDIQGSKVASSPSSSWITSSSGNITLHSPLKDSTVKSGDIISGTSKLNSVQYRIVSDKVGVVAQGQLSVVNNKFSGILQFSSPNGSGHLDIFSYDPKNGSEINSIRITINLGS